MKSAVRFAAVLAILFAASPLLAAPVKVTGPDGALAATFELLEGKLFYSLADGDRVIVDRSLLSIIESAETEIVDQKISLVKWI